MKVKLDENLPERLVARLAALGYDVVTVRMEGFAGYDDAIVWQEAQSAPPFFHHPRSGFFPMLVNGCRLAFLRAGLSPE